MGRVSLGLNLANENRLINTLITEIIQKFLTYMNVGKPKRVGFFLLSFFGQEKCFAQLHRGTNKHVREFE